MRLLSLRILLSIVVLGNLPTRLARADLATRSGLHKSSLVAHEWGVWKIRAGKIEHLEDLLKENPPFVFSPSHPQSTPSVPNIARKPVLFLYASEPMPVSVSVGFVGGQPWTFYPGASAPPGRAQLTW